MGRNKLNNVASGDIIPPKKINDIHRALIHDFVGRSDRNAPKRDQNLGTALLRWNELRAEKIFLNNIEIDPDSIGSPANVVLSGRERTDSNQAIYLTPDTTPNGGTATIKAASTDLKYKVNDELVTLSSDINISSLTLAPSSNNTCMVDDASADGGDRTRTYGEKYLNKDFITIDTAGSEITSRVGTIQAFRIGGGYFLAKIESATQLRDVRSGIFFNSVDSPLARVAMTDNDVITLMQAGWVFLENNASTVDVSFNAPTVSFAEPSSPVVDDYWFDISNETWRRYNGTSFVQVNRTYIGMVICDDTDCQAAVSEEFFSNPKRETWNRLKGQGTGLLRGNDYKWFVGVDDREIRTEFTDQVWRGTNVAAAVDTHDTVFLFSAKRWYSYMARDGDRFISTFDPIYNDRKRGFYHPNHNWRLIGEGEESSNTFVNIFSTPGEKVDGAPETDSGIISKIASSSTSFLNFTLAFTSLDANNVIPDGTGFTPRRPGVYYLEMGLELGVSGGVALLNDTLRFQTLVSPSLNTKEFARCNVTQFPIAYGLGWRSFFACGFTFEIENANEVFRLQFALLTGSGLSVQATDGNFALYYLGNRWN